MEATLQFVEKDIRDPPIGVIPPLYQGFLATFNFASMLTRPTSFFVPVLSMNVQSIHGHCPLLREKMLA